MVIPDTQTQRKLLITALLTLGLVFAGIWTNTLGNSIDLMPAAAGSESIVGAPSADAFRFGRLLTAILFIVFARSFPKIQKATAIIVAIIMSVASAASAIAYHQNLIDPQILALVGIFFAIAGYSFIVWIFYRQFARKLAPIYAVWGISISLVLEIWLSSITIFLSTNIQIVMVLILPFLAVGCYFVAYALDSTIVEPKPSVRIDGGYEQFALLAQVIIITVALVFIQALSSAGTWGETRGSYMGQDELTVSQLFIVGIVVIALTFLVFHLPRKRLSLSLRCIIGFGTILFGLQLLAFSSDNATLAFLEPITAGIEQFSHLVRWLMIIECVRLLAMPSYRIAGIAHAASALVSLLWLHVISELAFGNSTLVMVIIYVLLMLIIFIFVKGYLNKTTKLWVFEEDSRGVEFVAFATRYELSPRETDVFISLMQNHKYSEIEQEHSMSAGTVKTHVNNLYRKLEVHSKSEMRQLFEQTKSKS